MIVYFSSVSEQTKTFVEKLSLDSVRIPLNATEAGSLLIDEDYVLVVPSYAAGGQSFGVPRQVVKFLANEANRDRILGVIAGGNRAFGEKFCIAGDQLSVKLGIPVLMRFELTGTIEEVTKAREGLESSWKELVRLRDVRISSLPEHGVATTTEDGDPTGTRLPS